MEVPQIMMIIYLTVGFVFNFFKALIVWKEDSLPSGVIIISGAIIKVVLLATVLYYGGFWN